MKSIAIIFFAICLGNLCIGQSLDVLQKKGDSLYKAREFRNAATTFSEAAKLVPANQSYAMFRTRLSACRSWAMANVSDSAFAELRRISNIKNLIYLNLISLSTDQDLAVLHDDLRWTNLTEKMFAGITRESFEPLDETYTQEEIIYGRKDGMALSMLRLTPKSDANGKAIVMIRSGGWGSMFYMPYTSEAIPFLRKGYNVFIVFHGSEPVYTVVDAIEDVQRAVRFIRYNAKAYSVDPKNIGAISGSAGGHLALMCGLSESTQTKTSPDPVDHVSSKVQAVVAFSPIMNFSEWDDEGNDAFSAFLFKQSLVHVLEFRRWDALRRRFTYVTDSSEVNTILKNISPTYHVSHNDAAVMVFHGNRDQLVPVWQAEVLERKLREANVPVAFTYKKDGEHLWPRTNEETEKVLDWFDKYLK